MNPRRFEAPAENRGILAEPAFAAVPAQVEANRNRLADTNVVIDGLPLREFRTLARRDAIAAAVKYTGTTAPNPFSSLDAPLVLAGHEPELSHPGVWVKHFAINGLARQISGIPLNLVADHDTVKRTALRIPVLADDPAAVYLGNLPFDRLDGEEPYETRPVRDRELFRSVPERSAPLCRNWSFEPLLPTAWRSIPDRPGLVLGERFAELRRTFERAWDCHNLELPVSRMCGGEAFVRFVRHLLGDLARFRTVYNAALARYRLANGLRSRNHPAPDLGPAEAPFWVQSSDGRRDRATAQSNPANVRPRALTLTLFARICLGDHFVHGIGGSKYDEVTDAIIRDYFGFEPPAFMSLSATLHLPLPTFSTTDSDLRQLVRQERDCYWNPQRYLQKTEAKRHDVEGLVHRHRELTAVEPVDQEGRRRRFQEFREIGEQLRRILEPVQVGRSTTRARAEREVAANAILKRRDYAWVLFPEKVLKPFLQKFLDPVSLSTGQM